MPPQEPSKRVDELTRRVLDAWLSGDDAIETEPVPGVLNKLGPGAVPLILREPADGEGPVETWHGHEAPSGHEPAGRLEVIGEVARGAMGVIYKARDTALGRDVALKTLLERHADNDELRRRFIEEAQICSQLYHPGIVPVHDMGLLDDGRPYFLMKLLKGRTLAALLKERRGLDSERRRFLDIFDRLCQAVAYAHSRCVIHRDLKPSNILVGGFGETQVMDWGLAKVVSQGGVADEPLHAEATDSVETLRSRTTVLDSLGGSVFGTAPYMAPEQAQGRVDEVDERTDVFSLGAILLEILTGQPPYVGKTREEVLARAAAVDLKSARQRLESCAADAELLSLVRACLSKEPSERPPSAGAVSQTVSDYLTSSEERAHQAKLTAVKEGMRAQNERRVRRLSLAMAAMAMTALVVCGIAYLWIQKDRRDREFASSRVVADTMERARLLGSEAASAASIDLGQWERAVAAARDAEALATKADVNPQLRIEAHQLSVDLNERRAAEVKARDFGRQLDDIRPETFDQRFSGEIDVEYERAFTAYGMDVDNSTAAELSVAIRNCSVSDEIVTALDSWAVVRRKLHPDDLTTWTPMVEAAMLADPDPWRTRLRRCWIASDLESLRAFMGTLLEREADPNTLSLLARAVINLGDFESGLQIFRSAQLKHPASHRLADGTARLLKMLPDYSEEERVRLFTAALALRPKSSRAWVYLARATADAGDGERALALLEEARKVEPDYRSFYSVVIGTYLDLGETEKAWAAYGEVLRSEGDQSLYAVGKALQQRDYLDRAITAYKRELEFRPGNAKALCLMGLALMNKGRCTEALQALREGHALGSGEPGWSYPSASWLRKAEADVILERQLQAIQRGQEDPPLSAYAVNQLARIANLKGQHVTEANLHAWVIDELQSPDTCKHCAAAAAVLVGGGVGIEAATLDATIRASWTSRAQRWLNEVLESADPNKRSPYCFARQEWSEDKRFDPVRSGPALERLPPEERAAWISLWARLDEMSDQG